MIDPSQIKVGIPTMNNEPNLFDQYTKLVVENDSLKRELEITKKLITKGVLDSHSYILGYADGKESMQSEIEILKQSLRESNAEDE